MRKRNSLQRLLSVILVLTMVLTAAVPALAAQQDSQNFKKVDNIFDPQLSALQQTQQVVVLDQRDPEEEVRVSIVLEEKSTISAGFAPIGIASDSEAMAYRDNLKIVQEEMTATIESVTGSELDVVWNLTLAANIISANVKYGQIETIRAIPGVADVFEERIYSVPETVEDGAVVNPNMAQSKSQIGSETAWNAGYTGAGMRIAIIDTGLDVQHEAFSADAFEYSLRQLGGSYDLMTSSDIQEVLTQLNAYKATHCSASQLYFNSKVPFGFNYANEDYAIDHASARSEHGSHVAGISAANKYVKVNGTYYEALGRSGVQGVAPDAQILVMKVFGPGCSMDSVLAAVEDALLLGADSINLSLGSEEPGFSSEYVRTVFEQLVDSGVVVTISAGNSGHWYDSANNEIPFLYLDDVSTQTAGSPGTWTNSLCVASVDSADAETAEYYEMSFFSGWGIPGSLTMKPEISAPGGGINSVYGYVPGKTGSGHTSYVYKNGTSMAAPQVAGMAALILQYIRENNLDSKTGLDARTLSQSLLMSTAEPMRNAEGLYYPILQQGAGMGNIGNAVSADSFLLMGEDATASWADGKVKAELGDDPDRTGSYTFSFTIHNITNSAKTFQLSADVFTQGYGTIDDVYYMDRITTDLDADITWELPGSGGGNNRDYNGDGVVDVEDGKYMLAFVVGAVDAIAHEDQADINGDGRITSYDAYLFFTTTDGVNATNSVQVPANGAVEVEVTIALTAAQKAQLDQYYTNGAYIQAYVYAESGTTSHSIPVLGFYGNWTDPSMFDKGSAMEYRHGEETRTPYIHTDRSKVNTVKARNNEGTTYHLGGNPVVQDTRYMPERNAINNQAANIASVGYTLIRNAGEVYAVVRNTADNTYNTKRCLADKGVKSAYANEVGNWFDGWYERSSYWNLSGIPENTPLEVGVVAIPEYYTLREDYSFDAVVDELGDGAFMTVPVVIDNTAPAMNSYSLRDNDTVLRVSAADNQYVAAVSLVSTTGTVLAQVGSRSDARKGQTLDFDLDVSGVSGSQFYILVYDYAGNLATFELNEPIGNVSERVTGISIVDSTDRLLLGKLYPFAADVQPENLSNRSVSWSSSDRSVATVDQMGEVIAVGVGTCTITATSVLDPSFKASCELTVYEGGTTISGLLWDNCDNTVIYDWDLDASNGWTTRVEGPINKIYTSATQIPGTDRIFACDYSNYYLYEIDAATGQVVDSYNAITQNGNPVPMVDIAYSHVFSTSSTPKFFCVYQNQLVIAMDPTAIMYSYINCSSFMSGRGLVAVTSLGEEEYSGVSTEHVIALDNKGFIWDFRIKADLSGYWKSSTPSNLCDIGALQSFIRDGNDIVHSFNSLYAAEDGTLYLASFCGGQDLNRGTKIYTLERTDSEYYARYERYSGDGIYPASIIAVSDPSGTNAVRTNRELPATPMCTDILTEDLSKTAEPAAVPAVQLTKPAEPVQPQAAEPVTIRNYAGQEVTPEAADTQAADDIVIDIYARDANGNPIAQTNGMFQIMYDPAQLTLDVAASPMYNTDYFAVHDDGNGVVTMAFVGPDRMDAGQLLSTIVFENHASENATVYILHCDYNDADSGYLETYTVEPTATFVEWVQATTSLEGNIGLNFYVKLSDSLVNDPSTAMRFIFNGETIDVPLSEAVASGGQYKFTCPINAKNMADSVNAQIVTSAGGVGDAKNLAVMTYCNYMIQYSSDADLVKLMKAMLNYGAAAQVLFNHNTDNLANAGLSAADKRLQNVDASPYAHSATGSENGIQIYNATLILETETTIRIYFKLTGSKPISRFTFRVDGMPAQPKQSGDLYYVEITNIAAQDLDLMHTVTVGGITVKYGGLSYVNQVIKNQATQSEQLVNTAKAVFAYNKMAEGYFNQ